MTATALAFHVGLLPDRPVAEVAELAVHAEELGFGGVWVADSQSVFRDAYMTLALSAVRTRTLQLATGVTNPVTRHPAVVAGSIATLDELSQGRAVVGIGVGESAVRTIGARPATLAELAEYAAALRALLSSGSAAYRGRDLRLAWRAAAVPIWLACSGPRALELGGRVADGVLFQVGADPSLVRYALRHIATGAESAGRDPASVRRYLRLACSVAPDRERARAEARGYVAAAARTVWGTVPKTEVPGDVLADLAPLAERYDYGRHAGADAPHAALITDRILDAIAIAGTPAEAVSRLRELAALGLDGFVVPVTSSTPHESMRTLAEDVLPFLATAAT